MRRITMIAVLLALLFCGCASTEKPAPEIVLEHVPVGLEQMKPLSAILTKADLEMTEISESPAGVCYESPDGQCCWYTTVSGPDPEAALRELTGFPSERLHPVRGTGFGMEEYRFCWAAENEEGTWLCIGQLHCDGEHSYGLAVCCREDADAETRALCSEVYANYGLYYDEGV